MTSLPAFERAYRSSVGNFLHETVKFQICNCEIL